MSGADPVKNGLVTRLDRPGGNLTGATLLASDLNAKRFELFHGLVSHAAPIGVLSDATNPSKAFVLQDVQAAARSLGVAITSRLAPRARSMPPSRPLSTRAPARYSSTMGSCSSACGLT
jgi:ABC-type uncharacterized transport system substrate-binding protein